MINLVLFSQTFRTQYVCSIQLVGLINKQASPARHTCNAFKHANAESRPVQPGVLASEVIVRRLSICQYLPVAALQRESGQKPGYVYFIVNSRAAMLGLG